MEESTIERWLTKPLARFGNLLAERDGGWFCHYCLRPLTPYWTSGPKDNELVGHRTVWLDPAPVIDHVIPSGKGGKNTLDNMVLSCYNCNIYKQALPYAVAIERTRAWVIENYAELQRVWAGERLPRRFPRLRPPQ